jgi:L-lactate dehydrogenase complex protein LldG
MQPDKRELIATFSKEIESLSGRCHQASSLADAIRIILRIAAENNCLSVVKQRLGIEGEEQIRTELQDHGIRVSELEECKEPLDTLRSADMAITSTDLLIANTGTLAIGTRSDEERLASCLPRIHVAIMSSGGIVSDPLDAAQYLRGLLQSEMPNSVTFISGPSRTADIEMKLILGVHGPHQVHAIILTS